jgi:hypothetical protein
VRLTGGRGVTPNGAYCSYSLDIAYACKRLTVMVEMVCSMRWICVLYRLVAQLARSTGGRGVSPQMADIARTHWILHVHVSG